MKIMEKIKSKFKMLFLFLCNGNGLSIYSSYHLTCNYGLKHINKIYAGPKFPNYAILKIK